MYETLCAEIEAVSEAVNGRALTDAEEDTLRDIFLRMHDAWNVEGTLDDSDYDELVEMLEDLGFEDTDP